MLLQLLSITATLYLSCLAISEIGLDQSSSPELLTSPQSYTVNLSCAECAFSYSDCSKNIYSRSYLEITFSTKDSSLLANNVVVFPSPIPMQFHAKRYWNSGVENVSLAYTPELQSLSRQSGTGVGDVYRLKLSLVDPEGRRATEGPICLSILQHADGKLQIVGIKESSHHGHHQPVSQDLDEKDNWSWRLIKSLKSYFLHLDKISKTKLCVSDYLFDIQGNVTDVNTVSPCRGQGSLADWTGDRHYMRLIRPVLVPGVLGLAAGILASVLAVFVKRLLVTAYYCSRRKTQIFD
ncbi:uncharacterized protein BJX67DRAFT_383895 [Aspergillus lucknowensis]|uniref:Uncharacterized protein n=1 Tax=Aspergillus lucknowensis TaxID=176173 RepID=A0ABR4LI44_9EURO